MQNTSELKKYDNLTQLKLLISEIDYIIKNNLAAPNKEWFDDRFTNHIVMYYNLDWEILQRKFKNTDAYIHDNSILIRDELDTLLEQRYTITFFNLFVYQSMLNNVYTFWNYYNTKYIQNETDDDFIELMIGIATL